MSKKGSLLVLSGLSGAGKGTIVKRLLEKYPDDYVLSISATTRKPREGEVDGREYFFKSKEEFKKMIENDQFLEWANYVDNFYGTPKEWVLDQMKHNKTVILEIEIQGGFQIKEMMPEAVLVFVLPPDMEELERRLRGRGTETEEQIQNRLKRAQEEILFVDRYDYSLVNKTVENSVDLLHNIILTNTGSKKGE